MLDEKIYTAKELCAILRINIKTLYSRIATGRAPKPLWAGKPLRFKESSIERWLFRQERKSRKAKAKKRG